MNASDRHGEGVERRQLNRGDALALAPRPLRPGRFWWHPSVYEIEWQGRPAVWKDAGGLPWPFRPALAATLRREARILERLQSLESAPRLLGLVGPYGYLMEKLDAVRMPHLSGNDLTPAFFDSLLRELRAMHGMGVTHGDLRRKNVLIDPVTKRPRLIDFGTSLLLGPGPGPLRRRVWKLGERIDLLRFAKLKVHYLPDALTAEERDWIERPPWHYRIGSLARDSVYRPLKWRNLRKTLGRWKRRLLGRNKK